MDGGGIAVLYALVAALVGGSKGQEGKDSDESLERYECIKIRFEEGYEGIRKESNSMFTKHCTEVPNETSWYYALGIRTMWHIKEHFQIEVALG